MLVCTCVVFVLFCPHVHECFGLVFEMIKAESRKIIERDRERERERERGGGRE